MRCPSQRCTISSPVRIGRPWPWHHVQTDLLTKSRYAGGLQCMLRLWLSVHEPGDWEVPEPGSSEHVGLEKDIV
jgi:hypothetical protein